jgi:hypothetical protein
MKKRHIDSRKYSTFEGMVKELSILHDGGFFADLNVFDKENGSKLASFGHVTYTKQGMLRTKSIRLGGGLR